MRIRLRVCAWICLALLTLVVLDSAYWTAFAVWMLAYPFADPRYWKPHFFLYLALTAISAALWLAVATYLLLGRIAHPRKSP